MLKQGGIYLRILVLSDSHRAGSKALAAAVERHPEAETVIFLGDGAGDFENCFEKLSGRRVYAVCGNNDFYCNYPKKRIILENNIKIYITHGHYEYVKSGLGHLLDSAKAEGCSLALYGHTHRQQADYADSVHLFCPGALMNGEYGVVDITDNGLICIGMKI